MSTAADRAVNKCRKTIEKPRSNPAAGRRDLARYRLLNPADIQATRDSLNARFGSDHDQGWQWGPFYKYDQFMVATADVLTLAGPHLTAEQRKRQLFRDVWATRRNPCWLAEFQVQQDKYPDKPTMHNQEIAYRIVQELMRL
jgi:hypothetical protein